MLGACGDWVAFGSTFPGDTWRGFVREAARKACSGATTAEAGVSAGGDQQILVDVGCELAEDSIVVTFGFRCMEKVAMESGDGLSDGVHGALCVVVSSAAVLSLELGDFFQLAQGLGFDGFDL